MTKRMKEQRAQQDWEKIEQQLAPTAEQIEDQIKWAERQLSYHQGQSVRYEVTLAQLRQSAPRNAQLESKRLQ